MWPFLAEFLLNSAFSPGLPSFLRAVAIILKKLQKTAEIDYAKHRNFSFICKIPRKTNKIANTPRPHAIILRLTILLYKPHVFPGLGREIVQVFPAILQVLDPDFAELPAELLAVLSRLQRVFCENPAKAADSAEIDAFWRFLVSAKSQDKSFVSEMSEFLTNSFKNYCNNPEFLAALCRMTGILLAHCEKLEEIKYGLERLFAIVHPEYSNNIVNFTSFSAEPTPDLLRNSVAEAYGYVSRSNFSIVFEKLKQILSSEVLVKRPVSAFSAFFSKNCSADDGMLNIRVTCLLCVGFIAKIAKTCDFHKNFDAIICNILPFLEKSATLAVRLAAQRALLQVCQVLERDRNIAEIEALAQKNRENLFEAAYASFVLAEKASFLRIFAIRTLSSLLKLRPARESEQFQWLFRESAELLWENCEKEGISQVFSETLAALLSHEQLCSAETAEKLGFCEVLLWIFAEIAKKSENVAVLRVFFEELARNLEEIQRKTAVFDKNERKNVQKLVILLQGFAYLKEIRCFCVRSLQKIIGFFYEGELQELEFLEFPENCPDFKGFNAQMLKILSKCGLTGEELAVFVGEIVESLRNSEFFLIFFEKIERFRRKLGRFQRIERLSADFPAVLREKPAKQRNCREFVETLRGNRGKQQKRREFREKVVIFKEIEEIP